MFGVSLTELVVIFVVALLLFGPEQLPQLARQLGKIMAELRKGSDSVRREFYNSVYPPGGDLRQDLQAGARNLRSIKNEILNPFPELNAPPPPVAPNRSIADPTPSTEIRAGDNAGAPTPTVSPKDDPPSS